jgi:hypothetical protein
VSAVIKNPAPGAPVPPILPPQDGYLFLDRTKLRESFAADVSAEISPWGGGNSVSDCNLLKRNALSTVELSSFP